MDPTPEVAAATTADAAVAEVADIAVGRIPTHLMIVLLAVAMATIWLVAFDNGQASAAMDHTGTFLHEFFHDGRHLSGAPCH